MKNIFKQLFNAEAVSNETTTSDEEDISHCLGYVIDLAYTGATLAGSAKIQYRMPDGTWRDAPNSGATATHTLSASGGNHQWHVTDVYWSRVRLSVTTTDANTATCTAYIFAKGV